MEDGYCNCMLISGQCCNRLNAKTAVADFIFSSRSLSGLRIEDRGDQLICYHSIISQALCLYRPEVHLVNFILTFS